MVDTFGSILRLLRQQQRLTLVQLAKRVNFSRAFLGNVETGVYQPNADLAAACDQALQCAPLLSTLFLITKQKGDDVKRRALMGIASAAGGAALLSTMNGRAALAATLDAGLRAAVSGDSDWDRLTADLARRHVLAPSRALGDELAAHLAVARERVIDNPADRDAARGAASLAMTYALWLGDMGDVPTAGGLHATSAMLADHSGDRQLRAYVRARAANRGIYEGWSARRTRAGVDEALAITESGPAALEAHAAAVHVAGLTGDLDGGLRALSAMRAVADTLPDDQDAPTPQQRAASFCVYLHGRLGTVDAAARAYEQARAQLVGVPLWHADARLYVARAMVRHGDVQQGAQLALSAVRSVPAPVRVLGIGVRDVLDAAGGARSDTLSQLRMHASPGPMPWETLN